MCGIVGLYLKKPGLEGQLGKLFEPMLQAMTDRGPDSAGFAIYGDEVAEGWVKLTLQATDTNYPWTTLMGQLEGHLGCSLDWYQNASAAVLKVHTDEAAARGALAELAPDVRIMSAGQSIEILKGMGLPAEISSRFGLAVMKGSHIIGHTRMATESAVTMEAVTRSPPAPTCAWCTTARSPTTSACARYSSAKASASRPITTPKWPPAT